MLKQQSIGQSILYAACPRSVLPPFPFVLGVELDHVFVSKWLIEELFRLGFNISYQEVTRFKQSSMETEDASDMASSSPPGTFIQYVADNVDHNLCTLDGRGTFHGMGTVQASANRNGIRMKIKAIKRKALKHVCEVTKNKGICVMQYIEESMSSMSNKFLSHCYS